MECDGAANVTIAPNTLWVVVVLLQVTGGVKLNSGSEIVHKMGETI